MEPINGVEIIQGDFREDDVLAQLLDLIGINLGAFGLAGGLVLALMGFERPFAGPLLAAALLVGLTIALFQALTSIQEMTLTFVPKILSMFLALRLNLYENSQLPGIYSSNLYSQVQPQFVFGLEMGRSWRADE